jgi:D-glycero-D-manno-heptose 1,7-bisphosphate phosphatase
MNKAVFLDRDGVVNEVKTARVNFVNKPDELYLLPGVAEAIASLRQKGFKIFIVTNQGGIGWGYMKEETLHRIHEKLKADLLKENPAAIIDDIAYCPHKPSAGCQCRKPKPGMLRELAKKHNIDLSQSWMVGDMESDIHAGRMAGCQTALIKEGFSLLNFAKSLT